VFSLIVFDGSPSFGEHVTTLARDGVQLFQAGECLDRQGHDVTGALAFMLTRGMRNSAASKSTCSHSSDRSFSDRRKTSGSSRSAQRVMKRPS
jgi:hypothetical protein